MFTQEQVQQLQEVEKQTNYYKNVYKLQGMPRPMSDQAVQIDRIVNLLGFNKDPLKNTRAVDIIMSCFSQNKTTCEQKPTIPPGWAIMPGALETDTKAFKLLCNYTNVLQEKALWLLNNSKQQLADMVIDHSVNGTCLDRIDRFARTCYATMEYMTEDNKIKILKSLNWYHDTSVSNFSVLRLALEATRVYPKDFSICDYVKRVKQHNGRLVFCSIPGIEPLIKVRGKYFKLIKRDHHYRYWIETKCLQTIAKRTKIQPSEWRSVVGSVDSILTVNDLFQV